MSLWGGVPGESLGELSRPQDTGLEEGSVSSWLRAWIGSTAGNRSVWPWQSRMTIWAHSSISKIRVKCLTSSPAPSPSHLCFQILFSFYHLSLRWRFVLLWISLTRMLLWESGIWFFFFFFFPLLYSNSQNLIDEIFVEWKGEFTRVCSVEWVSWSLSCALWPVFLCRSQEKIISN